MARAVAVLAALVIAAAGLLLGSTRLRVGDLLRGRLQDYGVRELATAAVASLAVGLCAVVVVRLRRGSLRWAVLLVAPVALLAAAPAVSDDTVIVYDASYVPLTGVTMSRAYSSDLSLTYGSVMRDLVLLSLAVLAGAALPLLLLVRDRRAR